MKKILICDDYFINRDKYNTQLLEPVFSSERPEVLLFKSSYSDLKLRGSLIVDFVNQNIVEFTKAFYPYCEEYNDHLKYILRPILITFVNLYLDRFLRILFKINQFKKDIYVHEILDFKKYDQLEDIRNNSNFSWEFNQLLIYYISQQLGIAGSSLLSKENYPEYPVYKENTNLLFLPLSRKNHLSYFLKKFQYYKINIIRNTKPLRPKIISMGFSGDDFFLVNKKFYGKNGIFINYENLSLKEFTRDNNLRQNLKESLLFLEKKFSSLVNNFNIDCSYINDKLIGKNFIDFIVDFMPSCSFEGLNYNLNNIKNHITKYNCKNIIGADIAREHHQYVMAIINKMKGKIIGVQHGGSYGYIEDNFQVSEFEYEPSQYFLTWGWKNRNPNLSNSNFIGIPSPRLSELKKNKFNLRLNNRINKSKKILFISNLLHRFPHISTCGQSRIDFINEIKNEQIELIKNCKENNIMVYHKPYHKRYIDMLKKHYFKLQEIGSSKYKIYDVKQKGLSKNLLEDFPLFVWDQVGTGTLDCFIINKPTMVLWQNIYSRPSNFARNIVESMIESKVIHTSVISLVQEVNNFFIDPRKWLENVERRKCIDIFCNNFVKTNSNWDTDLKNIIQEIINDQ